ncbi:MAG: hypothetical protein SF187_19465 [Deltaproteobacteria bacterium]|nr:hypothetical protein [Deltaproteobacteria bacterium]
MKAKQFGCLVGSLALVAVARGPAIAAPVSPAAAVATSAPPVQKPTWVRKADKGFFDDPMAIDVQSGLVALIRTDSASFAELEFFDLVQKTKVASFPLGSPQDMFERIEFTGQGRSVIVVVRDGKSGQRTAQRFDDAGKPAGLVGPATDVGFASRGNQRFVVRWDRAQDKKGQTRFVVAAFDLATLTPVGKPRVLASDGADRLAKPPLAILSWMDGYTQIFAQEPGGYDKAKDMRLPDRAAIFDVLKGEVTWRGDIPDVMGWSAVNQLRRRRPGRSAFAEVAEDQTHLDLANGLGLATATKLAVPFEMYDLRSLVESESMSAGTLHFSLTVDPLNPAALEKKKADVPKLDLYWVPLPALTRSAGVETVATHLLRTPMDERPVAWKVAAPWVVILRKFKNFARGGEVVEIYKTP